MGLLNLGEEKGKPCSGVERPPEGPTWVWGQLRVRGPGWMLPVWEKYSEKRKIRIPISELERETVASIS